VTNASSSRICKARLDLRQFPGVTENFRAARRTWPIPLALAFATLALYLPTLRDDFLVYDDQQYVTENSAVRSGINAHTTAWAFGRHASNWHPLTWLSHALDCQLYGVHPRGHHLTNILLHTANAVLLLLLLNGMTRSLWRSALVAGLFAWHPLHVESVAWVAERKDVLSAFFFLLTLLSYEWYVRARYEVIRNQGSVFSKSKRKALVCYGLALVLFALALMSKPMVVTLPFVLLLLDVWPLARFKEVRPGKLVLEKVPFLLLSAATCWLTIWAQQQAMASTAGLPVAQRSLHAIAAYGHYVRALFVPTNLAVYYPYVRSLSAAVLIRDGALLISITGLALGFVKSRPYGLIGWLMFLGMLVPVIGLVQVGDQAWADRYTYLPSIGLFVAVVWGAADLFQAWLKKSPGNVRLIQGSEAGLAICVCIAFSVMTAVQLSYWKNTWTLFEHAAKVTRKNPMAATMLGSLLAKEGKLEQAMAYYREALDYEPRFPEAHFFMGNALEKQGKPMEALAEYSQALWFKPSQVETHIFMAGILDKQNKLREAEAHYLAALKLNPRSSVAHNNLAKLLHGQGRFDDARAHYLEALKIDPGFAQAHNNFGVLLLQTGRVDEGVDQLRQADRLNPNDAETEYNLARGLNQQQKWQQAAEILLKLASARQTDPLFHAELGLALSHLQRTREAMGQYAQALLLNPDFPEALSGLSWILATDTHDEFRNGEEAARMAARACELTSNKEPAMLLTLAAALAERADYLAAAQQAAKAEALAKQLNKFELATKSQRLAERFSSGQPWRE
jgi:tetratricopeptide (TPR) repeat protein